MSSDFSRCSSAIIEEPEEESLPSKQDIFVRPEAPKLLPLNMLLSNDSMDSEPLLSCRSHATQVYGSLHASCTPSNLRQIPNEDCNEQCVFFKKECVDAGSHGSGDMGLNDMMDSFQKEIDTLMKDGEGINAPIIPEHLVPEADLTKNQNSNTKIRPSMQEVSVEPCKKSGRCHENSNRRDEGSQCNKNCIPI